MVFHVFRKKPIRYVEVERVYNIFPGCWKIRHILRYYSFQSYSFCINGIYKELTE